MDKAQPTASPEFVTKLKSNMARLRAGFKTKRSFPVEWRLTQLKQLKALLIENDAEFNKALWSDLRKSPFECSVTEQGVVLGEIEHALSNLADWMRPVYSSTPIIAQPGHSEIRHDPFGVTLVISAWNYPVNLLLAPVVGAICGGNAVMMKPSEMSPATAALITKLVPKYMDPEMFAVADGGVPETTAVLAETFDLIFFTGSGPVGKIVMAAAAPKLTPVVLELGGKSPTIVMADADIEVTARRIAWGKFMNAGQTCIAPDYVLAERSIIPQLTEEIAKAVKGFYGEDAKQSADYCRIVNDKNYERLTAYIGDGKLVCGGKTDKAERYISPTILTDVSLDAKVMQDEIFGPILPVIAFDTVDEVIELINSRPKPLALYLFTKSEKVEEQVLAETSSGGVCINDVVMHMPIHGLPFGGVGPSGMGRYHGRFSFDTFTHSKGVLRKGTWIDIPLRYAPYSEEKMKWIKRLF